MKKPLPTITEIAKRLNISPSTVSRAIHALKRRPTAIITFNDYVALDAIQYAKRQKIKINQDISFVSFANLPMCNYMENPPLASVEQFPYEQGKKAAEILWQLLDADTEDNTEVKFQLVLDSKLMIHSLEENKN
jgi:DNA-binding LacI/PurR family transcriptional regulator